MENKDFAMPMYKATSKENHEELIKILEGHLPTLREYGLIKNSSAYMLQSDDGTIIEMFEWKDEGAKQAAHEHPAIRTLWGKMQGICDFPSLNDLPESGTRFPNFKVLKTC